MPDIPGLRSCGRALGLLWMRQRIWSGSNTECEIPGGNGFYRERISGEAPG